MELINKIMYKTVTCWNTGNSYLVTNTENIPVSFYNRDYDGYYSPVRKAEEFVIRKCNYKPSIYKREWLQCRKDEYKYAFTEKTTSTTTRENDVYYNADRNRFISKKRAASHNVKTEYNLPHLIVW